DDVGHDAHDVVARQPLVGLEALLELAAVDLFHRDEPRAGVFPEFIDRHDVRMIEPARGLRLAAEARDDVGTVRAGELVGAYRLERDDALDHRVVAFVDDAHRAAADLVPDLVLAQRADVRHPWPPVARKRRRRARDGVACRSAPAGYLYLC